MSSVPQQHHTALDVHALREALEAHQRYLAGRAGGRRLALHYADLANCSLEGVDLLLVVAPDGGGEGMCFGSRVDHGARR